MSPDQAEALAAIGRWYRSKSSPFLTLGGYAGTGKTTLVAYLRQALEENIGDLKVAYAAYTGKASQVLRQRLKAFKATRRSDNVSTIHALIYDTVANAEGPPKWVRKEELKYDLIVVDEASMVDEAIWNDLLSFAVPILAVGDHGQLPPINSQFNLMESPEVRLEQIFRQEQENPIIKIATMARETGRIPIGRYGDEVVKLDRNSTESGQEVEDILSNWDQSLLVLCGYNHSRVKLNAAIRGLKGMESIEPVSGDRVVCLRNNRVNKLYNGLTGTITAIQPAQKDPLKLWYDSVIRFDDEGFSFSGTILRSQFGARETVKDASGRKDREAAQLFDFGYCLTVHKAQGSQAPKVLLFEERFPKMTESDWRRWLYTAVTRAQEKLTIVGSD
jgi:ATP-dependent exoDNAse (exonuclease V) alpha subunit